MVEYTKYLKKYQMLNKEATQSGIVLFGEDWLYEMPIYELATAYGIDESIYNRSIKGLCISDVDSVISTCVYELLPQKVFVNFGENEILKPDFKPESFLEKYEWLLYDIHTKCNSEIYLLSIMSDKNDVVNTQLKKLATKYRCEYIDTKSPSSSHITAFHQIRFFLRTRPVAFIEAMRA